ncbi:uncharacterized protein ARMOST_20257 [Armillaria ostoyae]|uniref:Uncharacterized protein n=1 Tax=Armillaria ostoyae TaxID=47428 RepID=A0A284S6U8_ARMOS|nr:uncharacterized protein ARMOST_20257 [Armillaria ostoyae]
MVGPFHPQEADVVSQRDEQASHLPAQQQRHFVQMPSKNATFDMYPRSERTTDPSPVREVMSGLSKALAPPTTRHHLPRRSQSKHQPSVEWNLTTSFRHQHDLRRDGKDGNDTLDYEELGSLARVWENVPAL